MPISPEMVAAKETLEGALPGIEGATGIDIGIRDEEVRDPEDLAVRIFVQDVTAIPPALTDLIAQFGVPIVVLQRTFWASALPDDSRHRPVVGGVSVFAARFANSPAGIPVGTLGAIARTTATPVPITVGLSNHHVLAVDGNRQPSVDVIN